MAKLNDVTYQIELLEKLEDIKKNRTTLERLGLIVWLDSIWLDSTT